MSSIRSLELSPYYFSFFYGTLGAMLATILCHWFAGPHLKIGTVNITGMIDQFIAQESKLNLSSDNLKNEVKNYGLQLNEELQNFSNKNHIVLLPSEAVIAGTKDYTAFINHKLKSQHNSQGSS